MTLVQVLAIGLVLMSAVAAMSIFIGFQLAKQMKSIEQKRKSYHERKKSAYEFLKEERRKAGFQ